MRDFTAVTLIFQAIKQMKPRAALTLNIRIFLPASSRTVTEVDVESQLVRPSH